MFGRSAQSIMPPFSPSGLTKIVDSSSGTITYYIYIFEEKIIEFIIFFSNIIRGGSLMSTLRGTVAVSLTFCVAQVFSKSRDTPPF